MNLFSERKYPVVIGDPKTSIGFCTVWNKIDAILTAAPELRKKCAIIGTLYSRQGVNVVLRNLALNPQIQTLVIWGHGPLSNTPFGTSGSAILRDIWKYGVDEQGKVRENGFEIEPEINPTIIETIRQHVCLLDLSEKDLQETVNGLVLEIKEPYMEPVVFDPPTLRKIVTLPREPVGMTIQGTSVIDTWKQIIFHVMRYGTVKGTQYGMEQREIPGLQWVVNDTKHIFPDDVPEDWPQELKETIGLTHESIKTYHDVFQKKEIKEGVSYTYGSRLRAWETIGLQPIDQIADCIIANLKRSSDSRRGVAVTFVPPIDTFAAVDTPCLVCIQALQSDGYIHLFATFRSHDLFKAAVPNAFGLLTVLHEVAEQTGFEIGKLCIQSNSAHIYEGDFEQAEKLIACTHLKRKPQQIWNSTAADLRGSFLIRLEGEEIIVEHQGPDGTLLGEYRGKTAKDISLKISQLHLISQIGHALDIGHELQKAEHAMKLGISYTQDPPLNFTDLKK